MKKNLILADLKFEYGKNNILLEKFSINSKHKIIGFDLNNNDKLKERNYLINLNKRLIMLLSNYFNNLHDLKYSNKQWRIIIHPWLWRFTANYYDRYLLLKKIKEKVTINEAITKSYNPIPKDYKNFIDLLYSKNWNYFISLEISKELKKNYLVFKKTKKKLISIKLKKIITFNEKKIKNIIQKNLSKFKSKEVFIQGIGLNTLGLIELYLKLGHIPIKLNQFENFIYSYPKNKVSRVKVGRFKTLNEFESILLSKIQNHIPYTYCENFNELLKVSRDLSYFPKNIFTGQLHINSDLFKTWLSMPEMKKKNFYVISHGGNQFTRESQELLNDLSISKKLLCIYKKKHKKTLNCSRPYLTNLETRFKIKNIVIVDIERPIYNDFRIGPTSSQIVESFEQNISFVNLLKENKSIFKKLLLVPYKNEGYNSSYYYKKKN